VNTFERKSGNFSQISEFGDSASPVPQIFKEKTQKTLAYNPEKGSYEPCEKDCGDGTYWKIHRGQMKFQQSSSALKKNPKSKSKKIEKLSMFVAFGYEFIRNFTEIPQELSLNIKLKRKSFENYIDKVLLSSKKNDYLILPGYLTCENQLAVRAFLKSQNGVASMKYSKKCKLFIFDKSLLKPKWLTAINYVIIKENQSLNVDLLFFVVCKTTEKNYEVAFNPEPMPMTAYTEAMCFSKSGVSIREAPFEGAINLVQDDTSRHAATAPIITQASKTDEFIKNIGLTLSNMGTNTKGSLIDFVADGKPDGSSLVERNLFTFSKKERKDILNLELENGLLNELGGG
jgi:hypothetical protein